MFVQVINSFGERGGFNDILALMEVENQSLDFMA
jgi:hypothetical protein